MSTPETPPNMDNAIRDGYEQRRTFAEELTAAFLAPTRAELAEIVAAADPADLLAQAVADMEETGNDAA